MRNIEKLRHISSKDSEDILNTWESAVRATHEFLSEEDIVSIKPQVIEGAKHVDNLLCIRDKKGIVKAFMGVHNFKIEMLFLSNESRGRGMCKNLVEYAIKTLQVNLVDVNEQNPQTVGFYNHIGFEIFGKSELEEQGNPFSILHMKAVTKYKIRKRFLILKDYILGL